MPALIPNQFTINSLRQHPVTESLMHWYSVAKRDLPWRQTKDPYTVWVSEVILQQTRVEQGTPYFHRFMEAFPTVRHLAGAPEDHVLALWQGLGYYSRARNMQKAAKQVMDEFNGKFPVSYAQLRTLKGVGPYTAAAIASICFDEREPVVDGNVFRAASRIFGIEADISKASSRKIFTEVLKEVMPASGAGEFNQAMMELGATVCKPRPECPQCPVREHCFALAHKTVDRLPVNGKKTKVKDRYLNYLLFTDGERIVMKKREGKDIWQGLYDFPQTSRQEDVPTPSRSSVEIRHLLSHQRLHLRFYWIECNAEKLSSEALACGGGVFSMKQILNLPKPKPIVAYLKQEGVI